MQRAQLYIIESEEYEGASTIQLHNYIVQIAYT